LHGLYQDDLVSFHGVAKIHDIYLRHLDRHAGVVGPPGFVDADDFPGTKPYRLLRAVPEGLFFRGEIGDGTAFNIIKGLLADRVPGKDDGLPIRNGKGVHAVYDPDHPLYRLQEIASIGLLEEVNQYLAVAGRFMAMAV